MSDRITLRAGDAEVMLDPGCGGRIAAIRLDRFDLLVTDGLGPLSWGCYPMVPWAGRLRDGILRWRGEEHLLPVHLLPPHAIHGTLVEAAWTPTEVEATEATLTADLVEPWPYGGRAVHRVTLGPSSLRAVIEVHAGERAMPATVGWHPWFPRALRDREGNGLGERVVVDFDAGGMLRRGPDGLPDGTVVRPIPPQPWDDCFVDVAGVPGVHWPGALEIRIASDAPCWVVYTEREEGVCVEPQTGPPDGLNSGACAIVEPGAPLVATMTIGWRRLG